MRFAAPTSQAARVLSSPKSQAAAAVAGAQQPHKLQHLRQLHEHADVSYSAYSNARTIRPISSGILSRSALTPEDAESTTNVVHTGKQQQRVLFLTTGCSSCCCATGKAVHMSVAPEQHLNMRHVTAHAVSQ